MKWAFFFFLFFSCTAFSQWKSYRLTNNGDTINCIDKNDLRQGRWSIKTEPLRGEPGYLEEGVYKNGKKEGMWRVYTSIGDLYAIEQYRWGNKDGKNEYFSISGPVREESWKAVNPLTPYDTVDVIDPVDPTKVERKVVKIEGTSVKHGRWTYYDNSTGAIARTENYFLDKLEEPVKTPADAGTDSTIAKTTKPAEKTKPKEVLEFEKKIGKKKVKVIDGTTRY